jgi:hypothetical protein
MDGLINNESNSKRRINEIRINKIRINGMKTRTDYDGIHWNNIFSEEYNKEKANNKANHGRFKII